MSRLTPRLASLNRNQYQLVLVLSVLLITPLLLSGCGRTDGDEAGTSTSAPSKSPEKKKEGNYITADPNPVPAGPEPRGKTVITWSTQGIPNDQVMIYVSASGRPETPYANGVAGTRDAPWIAVDEPQEFRLYAGTGANRKLLDKVVVTRNK